VAVDDNENEKRRLLQENWRVAQSLSTAATEAQQKQKEQAIQLADSERRQSALRKQVCPSPH
jgi:hypothetical protein